MRKGKFVLCVITIAIIYFLRNIRTNYFFDIVICILFLAWVKSVRRINWKRDRGRHITNERAGTLSGYNNEVNSDLMCTSWCRGYFSSNKYIYIVAFAGNSQYRSQSATYFAGPRNDKMSLRNNQPVHQNRR